MVGADKMNKQECVQRLGGCCAGEKVLHREKRSFRGNSRKEETTIWRDSGCVRTEIIARHSWESKSTRIWGKTKEKGAGCKCFGMSEKATEDECISAGCLVQL